MSEFTEKHIETIKNNLPAGAKIVAMEKLKFKDTWDKNFSRARITFIQNGIRKRTVLNYMRGGYKGDIV